MSEAKTTDANEHLMSVFFDVQSDLPRQGPGDNESTRTALTHCRELPDKTQILDVGCGPGAQTLVLAEALPHASIIAVDVYEPYLKELRARAKSTLCENRVEAVSGDMSNLSFMPKSFDLIWAEGSAYIMGIQNALRAWRSLLKDGGYFAFSELVWLNENPPAKAFAFFEQEYPAMTTRKKISSLIADTGYQLIDHFTLPDTAWWEDYYSPLAERLPGLEKKYKDDEAALSVIQSVRQEMAIRESFSDSYGYEFFVTKK